MSHPVARTLVALTLLSLASVEAASAQRAITTVTSDGVTIHGEAWLGDLPPSSPLLLLFHQGGSSGRGEYGPIAPWLVEAGYRVIAWDQRAGGDLHGSPNRTVAGLSPNEQARDGYCQAMPDLDAALDFVRAQQLAERVVVWGSSYSGSLVFGLAAAHPEAVAGVIAFSPAAGGPVEPCRARRWASDVRAPTLVLRPASEVELATSLEQRDALVAAGARFVVVPDGVHGSSMLVDARAGSDMAATRALVLDWLSDATSR
jgi:pimeloyl-ACP methyl ester carboxylesterase